MNADQEKLANKVREMVDYRIRSNTIVDPIVNLTFDFLYGHADSVTVRYECIYTDPDTITKSIHVDIKWPNDEEKVTI